MLKKRTPYYELGGHYFDELHHDGTKKYLIKRLKDLGYDATLEPRNESRSEPPLSENMLEDPETSRSLEQADS